MVAKEEATDLLEAESEVWVMPEAPPERVASV